jgi:DNA modification methylase
MKPYYEESGIVIYHGDCREVLPSLPKIDLVLTDPPYGMNWNTDISRFSGGYNPSRRGNGRGIAQVVGDNTDFDPSPWLTFNKVIMWGFNHFASLVPLGTTLVWLKRLDHAFGSFLSDAELAWMKGGHGVYCHRDLSMNAITNERAHPTQKPVGLMKWCVQQAGEAELILDPFMGSGTTLRAAKDLGRKSIGIEIEEKYCEIAANRLRQEVLQFG